MPCIQLFRRRAGVLFLSAICTASLGAQNKPAPELLFDIPLHVEAPVQPQPFHGDDGKAHLSYFLILTNWGRAELSLERIEVADGDKSNVLRTYDSAALSRPGLLQTAIPDRLDPTPRMLLPGRIAVLRIFLTFDASADVPRRILHRFVFLPSDAFRVASERVRAGEPIVLEIAPLAIGTPAIVISPPLRGGPWRAGGAAGPGTYHANISVMGGRARLAEQFAIDFQKVDASGNILPNPFPADLENKMFYSNRAEVYAAADGVVDLVRDGTPENKPTPTGDENMPVPLTRETTGGNQVAIRLANGAYALYEHFATGTIRVKVGDRVQRGQVIGLVGNSGNSKNPHLHFEIADRAEINAGQGLPYEFDSYGLYGHQDANGVPDITKPPQTRKHEMPFINAVLQF